MDDNKPDLLAVAPPNSPPTTPAPSSPPSPTTRPLVIRCSREIREDFCPSISAGWISGYSGLKVVFAGVLLVSSSTPFSIVDFCVFRRRRRRLRLASDIGREGDGDVVKQGTDIRVPRTGTSCVDQPTARYILHSESTSYANVSLGRTICDLDSTLALQIATQFPVLLPMLLYHFDLVAKSAYGRTQVFGE
ncbi:hypothetical protein RHGRI_034407 [Rhododendron griersonianum]|uniref:Uncharacterized protein n=1 Tax=Rhododendron griersonianum TaxID=479676 RepID=A0AAV6I1E1_9ERIC|nr:hypothetical protein RHGRI_034407 [Rhododendron griersonianum]